MAGLAVAGRAKADGFVKKLSDRHTATEQTAVGAPGGDGPHGGTTCLHDHLVVAVANDVDPVPGRGIEVGRLRRPESEQVDNDDLAAPRRSLQATILRNVGRGLSSESPVPGLSPTQHTDPPGPHRRRNDQR